MGKSTQARILADALREKGVDVVLTREPGGTPGAEAIRELLLHPPGDGWAPRAEALLFAAARSDHVERLIEPALAIGQWVICDRFVDSSRAYQGAAGALGDDVITALHEHGSKGKCPDLTIVLTADEESVARRLASRDGETSDAIGGRDSEYHARVNAAFVEFAHQDPEHFAIVDGEGTVEEVSARVARAAAPMIEGALPC